MWVPAAAQSGKATPLPPGQIIENVICDADPSQGYALYLPSAYAPSRVWPVIYFFDPGGRGKRPIDLYKDVAEKYGVVIAGSNNSRNFGSDPARAVNAIWQDTHARLALDERRTYTSGFSGGARVAGSMAMGCPPCQIAGVIAHGAGYPGNATLAGRSKLLYFFAIGELDFNWPEVITIRREREEQGWPYRVRTYSGQHQWAPAIIVEEAVEWLWLKSMQAGALAPDAALVDRVYQKTKAEADDAEKRGDFIAQLNAYRSLVSDFSRLKEVSVYNQKLETLKKSAELKTALRREQEQIAEQNKMEGEISPKLNAYIDGKVDDPRALRSDILQAMGRLKDQASRAKNEATRTITLRAFDGLWVEGMEAGQQALESRHFEKAETCFQLMSSLSDEPWPALLLAETHASAGDKKQAIKDLRETIRRGLKDANVLDEDTRLQSLKADAEFQKILGELRSKL